jgi:pyruvate/2-oxoglutarate/acetoin dehydrogenase E1 component
MVQKSLLAAEQLASEGRSVEVVDLRTMSPWDKDIVCDTVERTSRLLVVHEDTLTAGFGGEVAAWVAEHCFWALDAPVARVTAIDTFVGYEPSLEAAILPQVDDVLSAARTLLAV